ncbi:hypothetical protein [Acinetobacter baumannii]|uniref:hypothetical protein n=1 Tax=Acinetobacter baumannii TaxID=470 RepID=UPI003A837978
MDKPMTFNEWMGTQGNMVLLHANCCRIAFEAGQQSQQAKVEELQRRNQMLNDNIKEQGQKLVYQNEVIETQAEKLLGLRDEKAELQKRVDAALKLIESWNEIAFDKTTHWTEGYEEGCYHCAAQLEQVLNGGEPK